MTHSYLNPYFFALFLWSLWTSAPTCGGSCDQGRKQCDCGRAK